MSSGWFSRNWIPTNTGSQFTLRTYTFACGLVQKNSVRAMGSLNKNTLSHTWSIDNVTRSLQVIASKCVVFYWPHNTQRVILSIFQKILTNLRAKIGKNVTQSHSIWLKIMTKLNSKCSYYKLNPNSMFLVLSVRMYHPSLTNELWQCFNTHHVL